MDINQFQQWLKEFGEENGWSQESIFMSIGLLAEGTGTLAVAIKELETMEDWPLINSISHEENKQLLTEGLGEMLGNLSFIASQYDIDLNEVLLGHQKKLTERYRTLNN
ncbi:MAG: hypothetical protein ACI33P_07100 [Lysinibacillus sp.]